jgi:hypothetical protein
VLHQQQQQQQQQQGSSSQAGSWFLQGSAGQRYAQQEGAGVTAYVTPSQWSELAEMQVGGSTCCVCWVSYVLQGLPIAVWHCCFSLMPMASAASWVVLLCSGTATCA